MDLISSHFLMGAIPGEQENQSHASALEQKRLVFKKTHQKLKPGGALVMAMGTSEKKWRFQSKEEILETIKEAGFEEQKIVITKTTDPMDYSTKEKKHLPGNYFVVAFKQAS